ncbi:SseB protein N-terminal domain-containing protein [Quadrisphaera granulorum]|uniref:Type III secretion system (T3SS) SseB-like protein n=1 Tax=Quadrisphaera granulorum TaxID=317664 RepID=A0A315ZYC4_9ACTN|nr:SseB family protein [Quadrisphaera granulorum]PWJ50239.1 type III secretion system (T3SS) SseB-like protein [Quadrisphaera granulorum]SZE98005.1 SseB protein N-terminal domain-containing protein [Quadrisphaera granulorum]
MGASHPPHGGLHLPGRHGDAHGDSAGTPWTGRTLTDSPFAGDDGAVASAVAALLDAARVSGEPVDVAALVAALPGARLFVPVTAVSAGTDEATGGDLGADMAIPTLRSPDGRDALPVFTGVAALTAWNAKARPVPVEARRAAVSAVQEGQQLLVLDPGVEGPAGSVVVPRPALWALAKGEPWTPSPRDPDVVAAVAGLADGLEGVVEVTAEPGAGAGAGGELRVVVHLVAGAGDRADRARSAVAQRLGQHELLAERVDSVELVVRELPRALLVVRPREGGMLRRWAVHPVGATPGQPARTTTAHRSEAAARAAAAQWCEEDGGHEPRAGDERCRWCGA